MAKKVQSKVQSFKTLEKGTPYRQLMANRAAFSAFTIAAMICTGYLKLNTKSVSKAKTKGDPARLRKIVGSTAWKTWKNRMNPEHTELSVNGMNEVDARMAGASAYSTDLMYVAEVVNAIQTGGTVKLGDNTFDFCIEV